MEQLYCDPVLRVVADCVLVDEETAFVSDRKGSIAGLSSSSHLEGDVFFVLILYVSANSLTVGA